MLYAESLSAPRHIAIAPNGDLIVAMRATRNDSGGVVVLRDENGDGRADRRATFGRFNATEVRLVGNNLYTENTTSILRYHFSPGSMSPTGAPDTIVSGLPAKQGHVAKTFVIQNGQLYVNQGSMTNSCQEKDRVAKIPGVDPCAELSERAGIWRYSAEKKGQGPGDGQHFARGIRNAVAMAIEPKSRALYVLQHGRDQLGDWGGTFTTEKNAEAPAEEIFHVTQGADFGWPYCYFDPQTRQKKLAPEYGGDGSTVGRCQDKATNVGYFPAHWAPETLLFYTGSALPARYRDGGFVVFHGSWNRAPLPQQGFKVVFQPMANGRATGSFQTVVDGFVDAEGKATELGGRPMGLTQGRHGELYLSDDSRGRIWRIQYVGDRK
jgi:glucose/arabinose dehydrogenase